MEFEVILEKLENLKNELQHRKRSHKPKCFGSRMPKNTRELVKMYSNFPEKTYKLDAAQLMHQFVQRFLKKHIRIWYENSLAKENCLEVSFETKSNLRYSSSFSELRKNISTNESWNIDTSKLPRSRVSFMFDFCESFTSLVFVFNKCLLRKKREFLEVLVITYRKQVVTNYLVSSLQRIYTQKLKNCFNSVKHYIPKLKFKETFSPKSLQKQFEKDLAVFASEKHFNLPLKTCKRKSFENSRVESATRRFPVYPASQLARVLEKTMCRRGFLEFKKRIVTEFLWRMFQIASTHMFFPFKKNYSCAFYAIKNFRKKTYQTAFSVKSFAQLLSKKTYIVKLKFFEKLKTFSSFKKSKLIASSVLFKVLVNQLQNPLKNSLKVLAKNTSHQKNLQKSLGKMLRCINKDFLYRKRICFQEWKSESSFSKHYDLKYLAFEEVLTNLVLFRKKYTFGKLQQNFVNI